MATVQTFGVDSDRVLAEAPMLLIGDGTGTLVTSARATVLIQAAAAKICSIIEASFGAGTAAEIAALATDSIQFLACQHLTAVTALPAFIRAAGYPTAVDSAITGLIEENERELDMFRDHPAAAIGRVSDTSRIDNIRTSTSELGIDVTDTALVRSRREFDGRSAGTDEKGYQY
jgi:hypothetical protein